MQCQRDGWYSQIKQKMYSFYNLLLRAISICIGCTLLSLFYLGWKLLPYLSAKKESEQSDTTTMACKDDNELNFTYCEPSSKASVVLVKYGYYINW